MKGSLENTIFSTLAYHRSPSPHKFRHVYRDLTSQQLSLSKYLPCCFTLIHTPSLDERQRIMVSVPSTRTSSSAGNSAITRRSRRTRDPSTYRSSCGGSSHSMKTRSQRHGTSNFPSKELDHPDMTGGTEPTAESRRTLEPESAGAAEIVAKFQFTYTKLRCDLELLGWMFSDGSPVPGRGKKVTKFKTELTRLSLNELNDHRHRLKDLRYFVDRSDSHAWAERLRYPLFVPSWLT